MRISLIPAVTYVNDDELKGKTAVVIDVLRATSVMTTAII
ncbi:MAG TPA: 2-phosphosulfolactate phosphatase, partial [Clostridiaceae bacterium]|nr:2-phosphosulfolactate phosphatase [Clostridiaceae bacterium]HCL49918.1 2-phosphosulfolactate phosphatase [Clostridiaceae bacterium]